MSYCKLKPESKLYDDIFDRLENRENSLFLYEYFKTNSFIKENKDVLEFENGEPTFESIKSFIDFEVAASPKAKINAFTKELNADTSLLPITEVAERVVKFNEEHPSFIAEIVSINKQGNDIVVHETDAQSLDKKNTLENAVKTYKTINKFLADLGIPITILDANIMKYEEGLLRPDRLYNTVDDIFGVLNIANNLSGLNTIPEEFAHFILENIKSDPIIQRTLSQIDDNMAKYILGDEYDQVINYYNNKNRPDLIQREVLGRIYSKMLKGEQITKPIPYKNLIQRSLEKLKQFLYGIFSASSPAAFQSRLNSIVSTLKPLTDYNTLKEIITPDTLREFKLTGDVLAHTKENVDLLRKATGVAMDNLAQHIAIYRDKEKSSTFNNKELEIYKDIKQAFYSGKYFKGLLDYAYESSTLMSSIYSQMASIIKEINGDKEPTRITLLENAHKLKEIKNYIDSYEEPITMISALLNELELGNYKLPADIYISPEDIEALTRETRNIYALLLRLKGNYHQLGKKTLYHFYKEFFSKEGTGTRLDRDKKTQIDLMDTLEISDSDITLLDRWLQAASASSDNFIGLIDRAIQEKQQAIRQTSQEIEHKIIQMDRKFMVDGGKSTSFIYEKDDNNIPTAYLANPLFSRNDFNKAFKAFQETEAYKTASETGQESKAKEWYSDNTIDYDYEIEYTNSKGEITKRYRTYRIPSPTLYPSKVSFTQAEKEYFDSYIEIKKQLDFLLPPTKVAPFLAVQKLVENAAEIIENNQLKMQDMTKNLIENTTNLVKVIENDEMSYQGSDGNKIKFKLNLKKDKSDIPTKVLTNFDKSIHYQVPIYYTSILENKRMLSQDASSALIDYSIMANNYSGMHEIVDFMEITKDVAALRKIKRVDNGRPAKSTFNVDGIEHSQDAEINSTGSEAYKRIESLINTQVYGQTRLKNGTILGMDTNKALDALIKYTSWSMLGFNFFTGINNVIVGKTQMFIESGGKQFFTMKEWLAGDAEYMKNVGAVLAELDKPITTSKLGLLSEMFNVGLHWKETSKGRNFYKNEIENVLSHFGASFLMTAGEHHMQLSTAIAMLKHIKVLDNGTEISLYEALEPKQVKYKGKVIDGKMEIKKGVTNLDGSAITPKQIRDIGLQIGKVNQKLHGIYNQEDAMEAKRTAVGRLATMYRNFIMPTFNKRVRGMFGTKVPYDYYFHDYFEGYYTSTFHFMRDIVKNKPKTITALVGIWNSLSENEQANCRRSLREVLNLVMINLALFLLVSLGGDGEEPDEVWLNRMAYYMLKRNNLEALTYVMPWATFETILVSPTAVISPIQKTGKMIGSLITYPFGHGSDVLESGKYKGETKLYRDFVNALPVYNSVYDFFHIHEEDKRFKIFQN